MCSMEVHSLLALVANQLKAGVSHVFKVRAVNSFGNKDATPAMLKWSVLTPAQGNP